MITIIIATLNCGAELQDCLSSIRVQIDTKPQVIVVDGGSEDNTIDVIRENSDIIDEWSSLPDNGIYDAWNRALTSISGTWVLFMGADDRLYEPETLRKAQKYLSDQPTSVLISYGSVSSHDTQGNQKIKGNDWEIAQGYLKSRMPIPHQAVFHRSDLFLKGKEFEKKYLVSGDYEMLLYAINKGDVAWIPDFIVMEIGLGGLSSKRSNRVLILREYREIQKHYGLPLESSWLLEMIKGYFWLFVNQFVKVDP
ncbi:glycosyltransferase [Gammaproteobacteria bacterium]|nr:glycosyltransferase [Gammaproteobacteria bacterium]